MISSLIVRVSSVSWKTFWYLSSRAVLCGVLGVRRGMCCQQENIVWPKALTVCVSQPWSACPAQLPFTVMIDKLGARSQMISGLISLGLTDTIHQLVPWDTMVSVAKWIDTDFLLRLPAGRKEI